MMFYKETRLREASIGKIPQDWDITKLSDVSLDLVGGGTPSTSDPDYWGGDIAWMTSAHINGKTVTSGQKYITKKGLENSATNIIPKDNLLVATRVGIGKAAVNKIDIAISQDLTGVIVDRNKVLPEFLYWCIISNEKRLKSLAQGSTIKGVLREDLGRLLIPRLSLPEQRAVVGVLGVVDLAVAKTGEVIAKTERLKKGLMQELLTKGIGHKEYKQTPIGKIPKNWEFVRIKELGELQYGYTTSATQENTGIKFLRITDIKEDGLVNWEQVPYCHIGGNEFDKYALREGDLLFARIGATAGKTTYIGQKVRGIFASYLIRLKTIKEHVHPPFVFYFTQSATYWSQALRQREGQLKKGINATMLSKFMVPLPSFEEQQRIAEILSAVDHKLKLERKEKTKLERVKWGLMDLLLTGKVRVKV